MPLHVALTHRTTYRYDRAVSLGPTWIVVDLGDGDKVRALKPDATSVTVLEAGWSAARSVDGTLVLTRTAAADRAHAIGTDADPVMLEIFNNLFMAIAEEMGVTLPTVRKAIKALIDHRILKARRAGVGAAWRYYVTAFALLHLDDEFAAALCGITDDE